MINSIPQDIRNLNNTLNKYKYGVLINNRVEVNDIDFGKYRTLKIEEFEKYKVGVCWDFVNYEAYWFSKHNYKYKTIYMVLDDNANCPTHTFLLFYLNNKVYWFESSWFAYQGIHEYNNEYEAIRDILKKFIKYTKYKKSSNRNSKLHMYEYNTVGMDNHLDVISFMDTASSQEDIVNKYI